MEQRILERLQTVETALEDEIKDTVDRESKMAGRLEAQKEALDNQARLMIKLKKGVLGDFRKSRQSAKESEDEEAQDEVEA